MTPDEKEKHIDELKRRGQAAVERADNLLGDLALKSAKLKTDTRVLHRSLTDKLAEQANKK